MRSQQKKQPPSERNRKIICTSQVFRLNEQKGALFKNTLDKPELKQKYI